jgi:hypothetical protein
MRQLRGVVQANTVQDWAMSFLETVQGVSR